MYEDNPIGMLHSELPILILTVALNLSTAGTLSPKTASLVVRDIDGQGHNLFGLGVKVAVLFFITDDCPISNSYAPEINRIVADYTPRGIAFYAVYADRSISIAEIKQHAKEFNLRLPLIEDAKHRLVDMVGATVTPETAVLGPEGTVFYRGPIDDVYIDFGKRRPAATRSYLRNALEAILSGKPIATPSIKPIGCFIPFTRQD